MNPSLQPLSTKSWTRLTRCGTHTDKKLQWYQRSKLKMQLLYKGRMILKIQRWQRSGDKLEEVEEAIVETLEATETLEVAEVLEEAAVAEH